MCRLICNVWSGSRLCHLLCDRLCMHPRQSGMVHNFCQLWFSFYQPHQIKQTESGSNGQIKYHANPDYAPQSIRIFLGAFPQKNTHCKYCKNYNCHHSVSLQKRQKNATCLLHHVLPLLMLINHFFEHFRFLFGNFLTPKKCGDKARQGSVKCTVYKIAGFLCLHLFLWN